MFLFLISDTYTPPPLTNPYIFIHLIQTVRLYSYSCLNLYAHNKPIRVNELICDLDPYAACVDHFADTSGKAGDYRYLLGVFCKAKPTKKKNERRQ